MNPIHSQANRRILVIDDNRAIHDDFRKILTEPDTASLASTEARLFGSPVPIPFQIDSAYQGEEALGMVQRAVTEERPYAMAFLDMRMPPGWDGIETAKQIWAVYPDLQVVICTAYSDHTWTDISDLIGRPEQFLILKKPFDSIEVVQMAHALTEKWRLVQEAKCRLSDLELRVAERTIDLEQARIAALKVMEDAVEARSQAELANEDLKRQIAKRELAEQRLATQHAVSQALADSTSLAEAAAKILQVACQKLDWDVGELWTFDRTKNHMRVVEICHPPSAEFGKFATLSRTMALVPGEGLPGRVCQSGQPVWIAEVAQEADLPRKPLLAPLNLNSAIAFPIKLRDETLGVIEFFSTRIQSPDGELLAMFAAAGSQIGQFIERKQLEEQFRQSQKLEAFGQLAGGVAHDFNNILAVIEGHVHLLLMDEQRTAEDEQGLKQILSSAERAASLTRQLLMFSRRQEALLKPVLLRDSVDDLAKMLGRLIGEHIKLHIRHAPAVPMINADAGMMDQVVMNLVVNARDAMPKGGAITIRTEAVAVDHQHAARNPEARVGPHTCLSVRDTGCGIPQDVLPRIFEPFFTTKEVGKGTGLGLATVYGIVKQHRGWIEVESQVGTGTVFNVFLPVTTGQPILATAKKCDTPIVRGGHETILLVEDEKPLRTLTRAVLERRGYRVIEAASGVDALAKWEQCGSQVDLLLTDMVMPDGLTGRELAKSLQVSNPDVKVVYTSGYAMNLDATSFKFRDGLNFLQKPYHPQHLYKAVRECLDQKP